MHPYDRLCEHLLKIKASAPAREWLEGSEQKKPRIIGEMTNEVSIGTVNEVTALGANRVLVMGNHATIATYGSADALLFELPTDAGMREILFERENQLARECGMDGSLDEGQMYMLLRWK